VAPRDDASLSKELLRGGKIQAKKKGGRGRLTGPSRRRFSRRSRGGELLGMRAQPKNQKGGSSWLLPEITLVRDLLQVVSPEGRTENFGGRRGKKSSFS